MIDWQGLLKFSLKYTDGTSKSQFHEMSAEDKKWLEEAMQQYSNSEIKRIQQVLTALQDFTKLEGEAVCGLLEELQELLDSLDKGSTLYKMGGHITLLKIVFYSPHPQAREIALQIYASANQNDAQVQNESINVGALEMLELLKKEDSARVRENLMGAISATVRGENLEAKRIFIRLQGLELLEAAAQGASPRMVGKVNTLWRDLLHYDDRLHFTFNDLSAFSNTSNLKQEQPGSYDLSYDPNKEMQAKNELPANAHFKGCVKKYMQARKELFEGYLHWLKEQIKQENS